MRRLRTALPIVAITCAASCHVSAKGEGVGLWMEGVVSNVDVRDGRAEFVLTGRFWLEQYRAGQRSTVELDGRRGIPVSATQAEPFFAMTKDWRGGAIRGEGALVDLLKTAARGKRTVRLELASG